MLKKYITIEAHENFDSAKSKIQREAGTLNLRTMHATYNLSGTKKVLTLHYDMNNWIKVDGPGFIIDELEKFFIFGSR
ncbi:MAG: hypothetical protein ACOCUD_03840 [Bacillota bacterium]